MTDKVARCYICNKTTKGYGKTCKTCAKKYADEIDREEILKSLKKTFICGDTPDVTI